ncbi:MAG: maleylpyruvate isomerase N-terminal domain-containing protein, partial [Mycobacterium sp.]
MPDNEGAIVMMTFLQPPSFADSSFDEQTALIDEELASQADPGDVADVKLCVDLPYASAYDLHMHIASDTLPFHRTAVLASVDAVNAVTRDDLARPTPCAGWDLATLLAHMTVQHRGFAAAARGVTDLDVWDPATVAD